METAQVAIQLQPSSGTWWLTGISAECMGPRVPPMVPQDPCAQQEGTHACS